MNSPSTQTLVGIGTAALALVGTLSVVALPVSAGLVIAVAVMVVAFAAQPRRLADERKLVYRPVYVRRQIVQRRVISADD